MGLTTSPSSVSRLSRTLKNAGASTSHNPMGLHGLLQEWLYPYLTPFILVLKQVPRECELGLLLQHTAMFGKLDVYCVCPQALPFKLRKHGSTGRPDSFPRSHYHKFVTLHVVYLTLSATSVKMNY
jgi:hypothetical protein